VDNDKESNKLIGTKNKVIYFVSIVISGPIFLLWRYSQQGNLKWLDFVGAGSGVIMGFVVLTLTVWYANRQ